MGDSRERVQYLRLIKTGRVADAPVLIRSPADVHRLMAEKAAQELAECFWVLFLSSRNAVTGIELVTKGTLNTSLVHPREAFRTAIVNSASGIIVCHNHPSGDPTPSADDRAVTRQLVEAGKILDIPVHDHIILTGDQYFSFAEAGLL